ncbi:MAG: DUF3344 domain-containing protein [Candidatus Rokubacteria bacterium]|nr:DUF3344 domain-containing protein [Candidatus Rokubacteria bacterium]
MIVLVGCLLSLAGAEAQDGAFVGNLPPAEALATAGSNGAKFFTSYTLNGGHVAAGVGWRNLGSGRIRIAGIPSGALVEQAFLYWAVLNPTATASLARGRFEGQTIRGTSVGTCAEPCWGGGATRVYRADVTEFVTGNGTYRLRGFASGLRTGESPWSSNRALPYAEGATLVVIYRHATAPVRTIVLFEGCSLFYGSTRVAFKLSGFVADPVRDARVTVVVADGQSTAGTEQEVLQFNGTTIAGPSPSPWNGSDGPQPLWDTGTYTVTSLTRGGAKLVRIASGGATTSGNDCLVFVAAVFAVTARDTDGDGLVDAWERDGYDHDGNGTVDIDLPALGAKVRKKDVFLEIDYMASDNHSHRPKPEAIALVRQGFRNAPVANPDGTTGITLHVAVGNSLAHQRDLDMWAGFDTIKASRFREDRRPIFHYVIFAHNMKDMGSTSGLSRGIPGRDLVVSLGGWTNQTGTIQEQAGTLMHELGHNIGLRHGGDNHTNYKPNYLSVMNYAFQTRGLIKDGVEGNFDYSRFVNRTLDERSLAESAGIRRAGNPTNYGTRYTDAGCTRRATAVIRPIDWDGDGGIDASNVSVNVNDCEAGVVHRGYDDWQNLTLDGRALGMSSPNAIRGDLGAGPHPLAELDREADSKIPLVAPARLSIAANALGLGVDEVTWQPVGLEIVTHYNVYVEDKGFMWLMDSVPADSRKELELSGGYRWLGVFGRSYAVTAVDHYGNESALTQGVVGGR